MSKFAARFALACTLSLAGAAQAAVIGLGNNYWYTPTLANNLQAQGHTVQVVASYTSASIEQFDVYIQDGNSHFNAAALDSFVFNGGTLIELPWSFTHYDFTSNTALFGKRNGTSYGGTNKVVTLDASSWLLNGVSVPTGTVTVGAERGNTFNSGVEEVLKWTDGTALLGYKNYGAGVSVGFNLHMITSDSSPLNAAWSNQIVYNAVNGRTAEVPEPASMLLFGAGVCAALAARRRRA